MHDTLVLCYHALSPTWPADLSVTPRQFAEQLTLLARQGYRGVTFGDAVHASGRGRRVAVTFDDAFSSVLAYAKPVLDELGWPATVYAVTDHVGARTPLAWAGTSQWLGSEHEAELGGMDMATLGTLHEDGWEIGSHTASHPFLTRVSPTELADELERSRTVLSEGLGVPCESLAYPYGDHDETVMEAARAAGYRRAGTLPPRWPRPKLLAWPRVGVYHPDDTRRFRMKTSLGVRNARRALRR